MALDVTLLAGLRKDSWIIRYGGRTILQLRQDGTSTQRTSAACTDGGSVHRHHAVIERTAVLRHLKKWHRRRVAQMGFECAKMIDGGMPWVSRGSTICTRRRTLCSC